MVFSFRLRSFPAAVALAYGLGLWLVVLHRMGSGHEHGDSGLVVEWLRSSTLALPIVLVAVRMALALAQRLLALEAPAALERAAVAALLALASTTAFALTGPVLDLPFHQDEGHELPLLLQLLHDAVVSLPAALLLAGAAVSAAAAGGPLRRPARPLRVSALGAMAVAAVSAAGGAAGEVDLGRPCGADAPVKRFEIVAIDVDITLNRFGDHDPRGKMYVLRSRLDAVREQERSGRVSLGLRDDPIQPLVIRANQGDCVEIVFTNDASGGEFGIHIDGVAFEVGSSGDAVGQNLPSDVARGAARTYRYFIPNDPLLEGVHYIRPGPGSRDAVSHGLFGALVVEPPGSRYLNPTTAGDLASGWEAVIAPGDAKAAFREFVVIYHEVGTEDFRISDATGGELPQEDPFTEAYRPASRALNYRSEPFFRRLPANPKEEAMGYGSYTFGDPATPMPRAYLGEPVKWRIAHLGSEVFHVHHLHGGGIRWRSNPKADPTFDYTATGLDKRPNAQRSRSIRLDSQAMGPGEAYNAEIEGGAGGVQQSAGDFLYHCHIAEHYISGMWSFWRVFDTLQPALLPLPDRAPLPKPVDSAGLIGKTLNGVTLTAGNLDAWIRPQLPPQGVPRNAEDGSVWNWTVDRKDPERPIYLGEPEETSSFPNVPTEVPGHPGSLLGDEFVGNRPRILFNPTNGRPAYPLLRTHIGRRPPFAPNGHSGAPWLGETANAAPSGSIDPFAGRPDGICPAGATTRRFDVVAIERAVRITRKGDVDNDGKLYILAPDKARLAGASGPIDPLVIRANVGDCLRLTLTSEMTDGLAFNDFAKVNMHIHHVQFDVQGSDGVITGLAFEQSVRPFKLEDPQLTAPAEAGANTLRLSSVAKFQPGVWIGVGLGTEGIEIRQIESIDAAASTVRLTEPLARAHPAGEWAGVEFLRYAWFADVQLDNVFFHDHVDAIHNFGHGLVGELVVEPPGSTYHDPHTGAKVASGTIVDVHTDSPLAPGLVDGSFREAVLIQIDGNPVVDSTINLRAEPWGDRDGDASLLFSSFTHGDPFTPLPRAYAGDPVVLRVANAGPSVDTLHVDGHRTFLEPRFRDASGERLSGQRDTVPVGVSERFSLILEGGAGGPLRAPGDYLYMDGQGRRFRQGAWGIIRVLPGRVDDLQPLPGTAPPALTEPLPSRTGGRPPQPDGPGDPCPAGAPERTFAVSAVEVPDADEGRQLAFVPSADAVAVKDGTLRPEPLVLHAVAGECVVVRFTNERASTRASFHLSELLREATSSGVNVGFNPEQTVLPGPSRTYRFFADQEKLQAALIADFGGEDTGTQGLYGALVVAPPGATFSDPVTGAPRDVGSQVDVHLPGTTGYRDFTLIFAEDDPRIGGDSMPYPTQIDGPALVNYRTAPRLDDVGRRPFNSAANGEPETPILRAYVGDPMRVHALYAPGSEQQNVFTLGGLSWPVEPRIPRSEELEAGSLGPWQALDAEVVGGAGGRGATVGDFFYGLFRRAFVQAGAWGLVRVLPTTGGECPIRPLDGRTCGDR